MQLKECRAIVLRKGTKIPEGSLHPHGFKDHIPYEEALARGSNIGIVTAASGLWVIDIDAASGGSLEALEQELGITLPHTWEVRTPGKRGVRGTHLYFRAPAASKPRLGFIKGIDVNVNYVVAPPSATPEGDYKWTNSPETTPLADAPPELVAALEEPEVKESVLTVPVGTELRLTAGTGRWEKLRAIAGSLRKMGFGRASIEETLNSLVRHHCDYDDTISPRKMRELAEWITTRPVGSTLEKPAEKRFWMHHPVTKERVSVTMTEALDYLKRGFRNERPAK